MDVGYLRSFNSRTTPSLSFRTVRSLSPSIPHPQLISSVVPSSFADVLVVCRFFGVRLPSYRDHLTLESTFHSGTLNRADTRRMKKNVRASSKSRIIIFLVSEHVTGRQVYLRVVLKFDYQFIFHLGLVLEKQSNS
jgi:hypothetical protein